MSFLSFCCLASSEKARPEEKLRGDLQHPNGATVKWGGGSLDQGAGGWDGHPGDGRALDDKTLWPRRRRGILSLLREKR